jgi:Protein of unknown function (DUF2950)
MARGAGPVGENVARAIQQGYTSGAEPYHGYFFKVLKGQGPAAPLGEMDSMVRGMMIGGIALLAAPAEYRETGLKTFIVSHDGVVYPKDFGRTTLNECKEDATFQPGWFLEPGSGTMPNNKESLEITTPVLRKQWERDKS